MDHTVDVGMSLEDLVEVLLFPDVHFHELWTFSRYELNSLKNFFVGVVEVVTYDNLVTCFEKSKGGEGANVARPTALRSVELHDCRVVRQPTRLPVLSRRPLSSTFACQLADSLHVLMTAGAMGTNLQLTAEMFRNCAPPLPRDFGRAAE